MSDPYRAPPEIEEAPAPGSYPRRTDLGPLLSSHPRAGARGTIETAIGFRPVVDIHQNGLVVWDARPEHRVIAFEWIDAIHYDFEALLRTPPAVTLFTFDGARVTIHRDTERLDDVIAVLDREVTAALVEPARTALMRGEALTFGPVGLELDGIVLDEKRLPWGDLARVVAQESELVFYAVEPRGRFGWARLRDIPHPRVLFEVLALRTTIVQGGLRLPGISWTR